MTYQDRLKKIFKRMKSEDNRERYNSINLMVHSSEEEEIWKICESFWGSDFLTADVCNIRDDMNPARANMLLDRLEVLLNQLGWK